jgi:hypothetical protein
MSDIKPEQIDRWSRNQHLYEALKGMGLCVTTIPEPDDPSKIRQILVSADRPFAIEAAERRAKVIEVVKDADTRGDNVINFPGRF